MPPTAVLAYSVSKVALNALTIEMQKAEDVRDGGKGVEFYTVNPGHCRTEFNGFQGKKDPSDGAEVVVRLVGAREGEFRKGGGWEFEEGVMREVSW
jgi:NAD(P)-dependent dehydrogenase (short-subunit alcohol dehydrogenase family)